MLHSCLGYLLCCCWAVWMKHKEEVTPIQLSPSFGRLGLVLSDNHPLMRMQCIRGRTKLRKMRVVEGGGGEAITDWVMGGRWAGAFVST